MTRKLSLILALVVLFGLAGCATEPLQSSEGNVKVTLPIRKTVVTFAKQPDDSWTGTLHTTGSARAFEAVVSWEAFRRVQGVDRSLGQGSFMTSAGAPEFGSFDELLSLTGDASLPAPEGTATLRIFIASMKDGSQQDIVDIPLVLKAQP